MHGLHGASLWVVTLLVGSTIGGCEDAPPATSRPDSQAPARPPQKAPPSPPAPAPVAAPAADPPPRPPPVAPLVTADVPRGEDGVPSIVPELRRATRIGDGPWVDDVPTAVGAGIVDFAADESVEIVRELERARFRFVIAALPSWSGPPPQQEHAAVPVSIWVAKVETRAPPDGTTPQHRRLAAIRLYDQALPSESLEAEGAERTEFSCSAGTDLRARDIDGDGEVELTAVAAYLQPTIESWQGGGTPYECGAVAFLVGTDDWNVQAAFTRDYGVQAYAASIEVAERRETVWQLREIDGDGHADLRVVERWRFLDYFMGDYVGGGESEPASREHRSDRRELDCLYSKDEDSWRCPAPAPGRLLFENPRTRHERRGQRPW